MMDWLIFLTVAIVFSLVNYRIGFIKGYRKGALKILEDWKEFNKFLEDDNNDGQI